MLVLLFKNSQIHLSPSCLVLLLRYTISHNSTFPNRCSVEHSALLAATIHLPVTTTSSHNSAACVGGERCEERKWRWRSCCSLASSRLEVLVVTLICNLALSHIRSQVDLKRSPSTFLPSPPRGVTGEVHLVMNEQINAFRNLLSYGLEKVPSEMLGSVPNTQDFTLWASFLADRWLAGPPLLNCCCLQHCRGANSLVTVQTLQTPPAHTQMHFRTNRNYSHKSKAETEYRDAVIKHGKHSTSTLTGNQSRFTR